MRPRFPHYIRPAAETTLPRRHLILDVETRPQQRDGVTDHIWRLACSEYLYGHRDRGWKDPEARTYHRPWELWTDVNWWAKPGHRLVIWCHNLAFDLRASQALPFLAAFGFECEGIALDALASWARFTEGDRTVLLTDLLSWLPTSLANIGQDLGVRQARRPPDDAPDSKWEARCRRDVEITRRAVLELLDLVSAQSFGPWRPTGSGQSHSAWRSRWLTHRPLVHDQLSVLEAEREAAWTGRCEVWRWGDIDQLPATEFDLQLAYAQIGADSRVPAVYVGEIPAGRPDQLPLGELDLSVLARVRVQTDVETVPTHNGAHIYWPVGRFETTLWDPELRLLLETGAEVEILQAHVYRSAPVLAEACSWIIQRIGELTGVAGTVERRALKHWARALVGRCALRYGSWETWQYAETEDVSYGLVEFRAEGIVRESIQIGREVKLLMDREEAPDSLPQIPGWIMSECRRRLWELMRIAGHDGLLYVDTDSLLVTPEGARRLERHLAKPGAWPMTVKGVYRSGELIAPRMLTLDGKRRAAGIPLAARPNGDGQLHGEIFTSLRESMIAGLTDRVGVVERSYRLEGIDRRREHLPGGLTVPYLCGGPSEEENTISTTSSATAAPAP